MRVLSKLVLAAVALGAFTTAASAAVTFTSPNPFDPAPRHGPGETIVWNFNQIINPIEDTTHFSFTGDTFVGNHPNVAAPPAGDLSRYGAAEPGEDATFSIASGFELTSLSFYLGSLDDYNTISFLHNGSVVQSFTGTQLTIPHPADGDQTGAFTNRRYFFTFDKSDGINSVLFSTTTPAFEFDTIAASFSAVPEPATWTMLILGFGFVGFMMRSSRQKTAAVIA